ncbi:glutamate-rich protein 6 [Rhinophrynus dorsalis]
MDEVAHQITNKAFMFLASDPVPGKKLTFLVGKFISTIEVVPFAMAHTRARQRFVIQICKGKMDLLRMALRKLHLEGSPVILIAPYWPLQALFPELLDLSMAEPFLHPRHPDLLLQRNHWQDQVNQQDVWLQRLEAVFVQEIGLTTSGAGNMEETGDGQGQHPGQDVGHSQATQDPKSITPPVEDLPALSEHEDLYSLSDDLSELSVLCDMEFSTDYMTFFEESLKTLPCVGPPTILAYKRESSEKDRLQAMMKIFRQQSENEKCEFCGKPLKLFPLYSSLEMPFLDELFCCKQYKNVFELLVNEQNRLFNKDTIETISIAPHGSYGSEVERQKAKEKAAQRLRERHMSRFSAPVVIEPTTFTEYGKPMKTISYQLSTAPPPADNWTTVSDFSQPVADEDKLDNELTCCDFTLTSEKMPPQFIEKYYRTGQRFLTIFPDGTAQIFYPSGNLAVIAVANKGEECICIVQEDKEIDAEIQAVFGSYGKSTCYHPNGNVWININPVGGQYSDQAGRRVRRWRWKSRTSTEPCVQFKPIFISLNHHIGVRITSQEQIFISFLAMGKQAKFSVGSKRQIKRQMNDLEINNQMKKDVPEEELILFAIKIKILSLLNKLHGCMNFPSARQWDRIKPPLFLVGQAQRLMELCSVCHISRDVESSLRAIIESHMDM